LLIWGDQDKTVPLQVGEAASKLITDSRFVVLQGAAHTPYYEKHEAFNEALCKFLGEIAGNGGGQGPGAERA
jgi:2-hydroxy-6-oxonona-2,4-dienedioate hydrolase